MYIFRDSVPEGNNNFRDNELTWSLVNYHFLIMPVAKFIQNLQATNTFLFDQRFLLTNCPVGVKRINQVDEYSASCTSGNGVKELNFTLGYVKLNVTAKPDTSIKLFRDRLQLMSTLISLSNWHRICRKESLIIPSKFNMQTKYQTRNDHILGCISVMSIHGSSG